MEMRKLLREMLRSLASVRVTLACLVSAVLVIFLGTLDQVPLGLWEAQRRYLQTFFIVIPAGGFDIPVLPGGYLIGGVLLLNLACAFAVHFRFRMAKLGLYGIHIGLAILIVGMLLSDLWSVESFLSLDKGRTQSYSESQRRFELAVLEPAGAARDRVFSFSDSLLAPGRALTDEGLPLSIRVLSWFPNARLSRAPGAGVADMGFGRDWRLEAFPRATRTDESDHPAALVEVSAGGRRVGTWLLSTLVPTEQDITVDGRTYRVTLRRERFYYPFAVTLSEFRHERHPASDIPSQFASDVRLEDPEQGEDRTVTISMNEPLRYRGMTFYQASFGNNDLTSILLVVRNPSWWLPYVSCLLMGLGMAFQFGASLFRHVRGGAA